MRLDELASRATPQLTELDFKPLDELNGRMGGERHGVWDWTWVNHRRLAPACFASLYGFPIARDTFDAEVWARLGSNGVAERSLVRRYEELPPDLDGELASSILSSIFEAARRAFYLEPTVSKAYEVEDPDVARLVREGAISLDAALASQLSRAPYPETVREVLHLLADSPEREWQNREILGALLQAGHATDRAAVNAALSDLAGSGRIHRITRGRYRGTGPGGRD